MNGNPGLDYSEARGLLARIRPNGALEGSRTENLILQAIAAELLTPVACVRLPGLVENLYGSVQTDLGADDIAAPLGLAPRLDAAAIKPPSFADEMPTGTRIQDPVLGHAFIWFADFDHLLEYVRALNKGGLPMPDPVIQAAPTP